MERISEQEYRAAVAIVNRYNDQQKQDKLEPYKGCTENDITTNKHKTMFGKDATSYWVVRKSESKNTLPERNPDGTIVDNSDYYTIEHSSVVYEGYSDAVAALLRAFKRKKLIDN